MSTFEVCGISAKSGERADGYIGYVTIGNAAKIGIPAIVINGAEDGPTLLVLASVHGTEVVGVGATLEAMKAIDPNQLRGQVIAVTACNPFGLMERAYETPYDALNLSGRVFAAPKPDGSLTDRLAALVQKASEPASNMIDMHANADPSIPFSLISRSLCKDEETWQMTQRLAHAFGITVIESGSDTPNTNDVRYERGLTTMTPELTGNMFLREETVSIGKNGILNVMKTLEMIEGQPVMHSSKMEGEFVARGRQFSGHGGLLWPRKKPGELIQQGETVVEIQDLWGNTVEEIKMPFEGYVWGIGARPGTSHVVPEGAPVDYLFARKGAQA